jgi:hypothetical protein
VSVGQKQRDADQSGAEVELARICTLVIEDNLPSAPALGTRSGIVREGNRAEWFDSAPPLQPAGVEASATPLRSELFRGGARLRPHTPHSWRGVTRSAFSML